MSAVKAEADVDRARGQYLLVEGFSNPDGEYAWVVLVVLLEGFECDSEVVVCDVVEVEDESLLWVHFLNVRDYCVQEWERIRATSATVVRHGE